MYFWTKKNIFHLFKTEKKEHLRLDIEAKEICGAKEILAKWK